MLGRSSIDASIPMTKNFQTFYDPGDPVNKVKLTTHNNPLCILNINIKSVSQMVTDLWPFVYLIGYNGKI